MDRKTKEEHVNRPDGKVFEIGNLDIQEQHRNPDYQLSRLEGSLAPMGRLDIFELRHVSGKPIFTARWDGGSIGPGKHEKEDLDIDICGVSNSETKRFERSEAGYSGHHPNRVADALRRSYEVLIRVKDQTIFEATVSFTVQRRVGGAVAVSAIATADAQVLPAAKGDKEP